MYVHIVHGLDCTCVIVKIDLQSLWYCPGAPPRSKCSCDNDFAVCVYMYRTFGFLVPGGPPMKGLHANVRQAA